MHRAQMLDEQLGHPPLPLVLILIKDVTGGTPATMG
jgi:hypothetical protein